MSQKAKIFLAGGLRYGLDFEIIYFIMGIYPFLGTDTSTSHYLKRITEKKPKINMFPKKVTI